MNINNYCWVKLTPYGLNLLNSIRPNHLTYNTDGEWTRFQLWEWASLFGEHLYNGADQMFESNEMIFERPAQGE